MNSKKIYSLNDISFQEKNKFTIFYLIILQYFFST